MVLMANGMIFMNKRNNHRNITTALLLILFFCMVVIVPVSAIVPGSDGIWYTETVNNSVNVGFNSLLALNAAGFPRISYYDANFGDLKYVASDGTT
jgi:hypothetical protein